jgi:membrane protein implicated in regulation of membrane protease activity
VKDVFLVLWRVFLLLFGLLCIVGGGFCVMFGANAGSSAAFIALIGAASVAVGALVFVATLRALKGQSADHGEASPPSGEDQA